MAIYFVLNFFERRNTVKKTNIIINLNITDMISQVQYGREFKMLAGYEVLDVIGLRAEVYKGLIINALSKISTIDLSKAYLNRELCNKAKLLNQANKDFLTYGNWEKYVESMTVIGEAINAFLKNINYDIKLIEINYFYMSDILGLEVRVL